MKPTIQMPELNARLLLFLILAFCSLSLYSHEGGPPHNDSIDSSFESILVAETDDTFSSIVQREFGSTALARELAKYNNRAIDTVFIGGEELVYPTRIVPEQNFAAVSYVKGKVLYRPAGGRSWERQLERKDHVYDSDVLETADDGFVSLALESGTIINVQPNSLVVIENIQCQIDDSECSVNLKADKGEIKSTVVNSKQQPAKFKIESPYASAAVRGTEFHFSALSEITNIAVAEGSVGVDALDKQLEVPQGFGVSVAADGSANQPRPLLPAPRLFSLPPRVTKQDSVFWSPVSGASNYRITFASDVEGNEIILQKNSDPTQYPLSELSPGTYHAKVQGNDELGLRGLERSIEINHVLLDEKISIPSISLEQTDTSIFLSVTDGEQGKVHEIQIASQESFNDAVSVDTPENGGTEFPLTPGVSYFARARAVSGATSAGRYGPVVSF